MADQSGPDLSALNPLMNLLATGDLGSIASLFGGGGGPTSAMQGNQGNLGAPYGSPQGHYGQTWNAISPTSGDNSGTDPFWANALQGMAGFQNSGIAGQTGANLLASNTSGASGSQKTPVMHGAMGSGNWGSNSDSSSKIFGMDGGEFFGLLSLLLGGLGAFGGGGIK